MKIANTFEEKTMYSLPKEVIENEYIQKFADKLMGLSNRLNEVDNSDVFDDAFDIKEDYLPAIQEFILNITGL